jgi:hypothetical protein
VQLLSFYFFFLRFDLLSPVQFALLSLYQALYCLLLLGFVRGVFASMGLPRALGRTVKVRQHSMALRE